MTLQVVSKPVGQIGFGVVLLTNYYTTISQEQAIKTLKAAIEAGANFLNGGWSYGTSEYNSLHLFKAYFTQYPEDVEKGVISIKACFSMKDRLPLNHAEEVRQEIEQCLKVADGKFKIEVFHPARLDPEVPVGDTIGAVAEYVEAGKVGGIGLSECRATSIRKL